MSNNSETELLTDSFLASLVSKCLYRDTHYGSAIPRKLENEIYTVDLHELPSGLFVYGVKTKQNPRFYRDIVIVGESLTGSYESEEVCNGVDARISPPCIILSHSSESPDRPDTVICRTGVRDNSARLGSGFDYYSISNVLGNNGEKSFQYLKESYDYLWGRYSPRESDNIQLTEENEGLLEGTIRSIKECDKLPEWIRDRFVAQFEDLKAKLEVERQSQPVPVTQIAMARYLEDLMKREEVVFEGRPDLLTHQHVTGESLMDYKLADRTYEIEGRSYTVGCKLWSYKPITDLSTGNLSKDARMEMSITTPRKREDGIGGYVIYDDDDNARLKLVEAELSYDADELYLNCCDYSKDKDKDYTFKKGKKYTSLSNKVWRIDAPYSSKLYLDDHEMELHTQDTVTPDQIIGVYERLLEIVKFKAVDKGPQKADNKNNEMTETTSWEQIRTTAKDFEDKIPDERIADGIGRVNLRSFELGKNDASKDDVRE